MEKTIDEYSIFLDDYPLVQKSILGNFQTKEVLFKAKGFDYPCDKNEFNELVSTLYKEKKFADLLIFLLVPTEDIPQDRLANRHLYLSNLFQDTESLYVNFNHAHVCRVKALDLATFDQFSHFSAFDNFYKNYSLSEAWDREFPTSPADNALKKLRSKKSYLLSFFTALRALHRLQKRLLEKHKCQDKSEYFSTTHNKVGVDFTDQKSRLQVFDEFRNIKGDQSEALVLSVNPYKDLFFPYIINQISWYLKNPDFDIYEPEISRDLFIYNVVKFADIEENSTCMSAFWLGHHFWDGATGRVDYEKAVFWFDIAMKLGHGVAPKFIYQILTQVERDERCDNPDATEFHEYIDSLYYAAEKMDFPCSRDWIETRYAFGYGKWNDQKRLLDYYESIIKEKFWAPPQMSSLLAYSLRSFLFENTTRDADEILLILNKSVKESGMENYYNSDLQIPIGHFEEIQKKYKSSNFYASQYRKTADTIRDFYLQKTSEKEINKIATDAMFSGDEEELKATLDAFWSGTELSNLENWYNSAPLSKIFEKLNACYLNLNLKEMKKTALLMGPFYNPIDPINGLPKLGAWLSASKSKEDVATQQRQLGYYVPQSGYTSLKSITAENKGNIEFDCKKSKTAPAILLKEDFDVVMTLVFGDQNTAIWPSISLEDHDDEVLPDQYKSFKAKIWSPSWLGYTAFGETLYITDRLAGQLTWDPKSFTIATPEECFDPKFPNFLEKFLKDLRYTGGADKSHQSRRISVSPEFIPIPNPEITYNEFGNEIWKIRLPKIKMRINGAYIMETEIKEDRNIGLNDLCFRQGRLTQRLTDHYDDICFMMPVFERAKQLMGLLYSVMKLRKEGFQLNPTIQRQVSDNLAYYQSLPSLQRSELVLKSQPFIVDF